MPIDRILEEYSLAEVYLAHKEMGHAPTVMSLKLKLAAVPRDVREQTLVKAVVKANADAETVTTASVEGAEASAEALVQSTHDPTPATTALSPAQPSQPLTLGLNAGTFIEMGFSLAELRAAGLSAAQLLKAGLPAWELRTAEFSPCEMATAGGDHTLEPQPRTRASALVPSPLRSSLCLWPVLGLSLTVGSVRGRVPRIPR